MTTSNVELKVVARIDTKNSRADSIDIIFTTADGNEHGFVVKQEGDSLYQLAHAMKRYLPTA
jgi:hypothetical protein